MKGQATEERFWSKVDKDGAGGCWLWTAAENGRGYGLFSWDGRTIVAHRYSYRTLVGPVPDGLDLDHLCRVRNCVNPKHLEPVTRRENLRRGIGWNLLAARQAAKTHCPQGHPYAGDNLYVERNTNRRVCRVCHRAVVARYKRRTQVDGLRVVS